MTEALITGLFTVLGAVLSALVTKFGLSFWKPAEKLILKGYPVTRKLVSAEGEISEYPYSDRTEHYENPILTLRGSQATFEATYVVRKGNETKLNGKIVSKGKHKNGKVYLTYDIEDNLGQGWSGVCLLYKSNIDALTGYYLVESSLKPGRTALGTVHLERVGMA